MATETQAFESVTEQAERLLAQLELPPEVAHITASIENDHTGDESLFVRLHLAKGVKVDIKRLTAFIERAQILLLGNGITQFPYVFLEAA